MKIILSKNPAKGFSVIGEVKASSKEQIKEKVKMAKKAYEGWKFTDIKKRIECGFEDVTQIKVVTLEKSLHH